MTIDKEIQELEKSILLSLDIWKRDLKYININKILNEEDITFRIKCKYHNFIDDYCDKKHPYDIFSHPCDCKCLRMKKYYIWRKQFKEYISSSSTEEIKREIYNLSNLNSK